MPSFEFPTTVPQTEQEPHTSQPEKSPAELAAEFFERTPKGARETINLLKDVLELRTGGTVPPHMIGEAKTMIQEAADAHGFSGVWNAVAVQGLNQHMLTQIIHHNIEEEIAELQAIQHENQVRASWNESYGGGGASFGMFTPTYTECLEDKLDAYKSRESLNTLLLGAMSRETANEFGEFSRSLNPTTTPVALDLYPGELQYADRDLVHPIQADAAHIPLDSESQDLVFTNFLTPFIHENGFPSGEKIMQVLAESHRVLREGGRLVMAERGVNALQQNSTIWINKLLLELSLEHVGFSTQPTGTIKRYTTRLERSFGPDMNGEVAESLPEDKRTGKQAPFDFSVVGDK